MAGSHKPAREEPEHVPGASTGPRVAVVVLGDLGRSPRMLYHARALADANARVALVGFRDTDLDPDVATHPAIEVHALRAAPAAAVPRALFVPHGIVRVLRQAAELAGVLRMIEPHTILLQTPPAIPTG